MGRRGPTPTDARVLRLRGTYREDRHGEASPVAEGDTLTELPRAPKHFDGVAVAVWQRGGGELIARRLLTSGKLDMLAGYCLAVSRAVSEDKKVRDLGGATYVTPSGYERVRPAAAESRAAWAEARQFATILSLTPASAARMPGAGDEKPPADADEDFLFGGTGTHGK